MVAGEMCTSLHAEIDVLLKARKTIRKSKGGTIYVVRIGKSTIDLPDYKKHKVSMSMPCVNCQKKLYEYNICRIYYTNVIDGEEVLVEMRQIYNC